MLVIVNDAFSGSAPATEATPPSAFPNTVANESPEMAQPKGRFFYLWVLFFGLLSVAFLAALFVRLPYFVLEPGETFETEEHIAVEGTELFPNPDGEVRFVTVFQRRVSAIDYVISRYSDSDRLIHEDVLLGGRTIEEQREENAQLMLSSQSSAVAAALTRLGVEAFEPAGVVIIDVTEDGPLDEVLARNDVITSLNGFEITTTDDLFDAVDSIGLDETIEVVAGRPGAEPRTIEVQTASSTRGFLGIVRGEEADGVVGAPIADFVADGPVDGLLVAGDVIVSIDDDSIGSFEELVDALNIRSSGDSVTVEATRMVDGNETLVSGEVLLGSRGFERIGLENAQTQLRDRELPFDVSITTEEIGGPSAGLAFTLTIIDVLTDGDLTGGAEIVVTGTIGIDGSVGAIGGAHQKAFAARDAGADVFIVPAGNLEEAQSAVPELRVEAVETLDEALDIISEFGGNAGEITDGLLDGT